MYVDKILKIYSEHWSSVNYLLKRILEVLLFSDVCNEDLVIFSSHFSLGS